VFANVVDEDGESAGILPAAAARLAVVATVITGVAVALDVAIQVAVTRGALDAEALDAAIVTAAAAARGAVLDADAAVKDATYEVDVLLLLRSTD